MKRSELEIRPCIVVVFDASDSRGGGESATHRARRLVAWVDEQYDRRDPSPARDARTLVLGQRIHRCVALERGLPNPFWELLDLVHLQAELSHTGTFLTGTVTWGDAAVQVDTVTGPALERACRMIAVASGLPRIVVDPALLAAVERDRRFRADHHRPIQELGYLQKLLSLDADGIWYVDYLRAFESEVDGPDAYLRFLEGHAQVIIEGLEGLQTLDVEARRWLWLRRYHNHLVTDLEALNPGLTDWSKLRVGSHPLAFDFPTSARDLAI